MSSRLDSLNKVLQYCTEHKGIFTPGERICINQERAKLISNNQYDFDNSYSFPHSAELKYKLNGYVRQVKSHTYEPRREIKMDFTEIEP